MVRAMLTKFAGGSIEHLWMFKRVHSAQLLALILAVGWHLVCLPQVQAFPSSAKISDITKLHQTALVNAPSTYMTLSEGGDPDTAKNTGVLRMTRSGFGALYNSWRVVQRRCRDCALRAHQPMRLWLLHCALLN